MKTIKELEAIKYRGYQDLAELRILKEVLELIDEMNNLDYNLKYVDVTCKNIILKKLKERIEG